MVKLPDSITVELLKEQWTEASTAYSSAFNRIRMLDATDRGKLWKAIKAKFPKYQVLPDTNHVAYVKNNLLASLYSVGRSADILPTSEHDVEITKQINIALEHIWDTQQVAYYQMLAGERAALTNLGITQVGWDNSILKGSAETFSKGTTSFKNIDPLKFMRDPHAIDLDTSAYCMTWDTYHKNIILRNKDYKKEFQTYLDNKASEATQKSTVTNMLDKPTTPAKDRYNIVIHWVADGEKIHEVHTVESEHVLYIKEDIKPSMFPFAMLYCNIPAGDIIGTSEPSKIFANSITYNLMNSIILTSDVKNQKPPRFVNNNAGINLRDFIKHGSDSDYTFIVNGDASKAVHYHQFPQVSTSVFNTLGVLAQDMQLVSGVDGKYTGKDTGSILTTGGVEQMLDQATLIDQPKIVNYEQYTNALTKLVLGNLRQFGSKRNYFLKNPETRKHETVEIAFNDLKDDTVFNYAVAISAHLPKNKQRISQMANVIMEKQMQYQQTGDQPVALITPEEWLMMQDLPMQEYMMERMGIERSKDYVDKVAKVIFQYAELLDQGFAPDDALLATADLMQTGQPPMMQPEGMPMEQDMMPQEQMPPMDF